MFFTKRFVRCAAAAGLLVIGFALSLTGEVVAQACNETGYTYDSACSNNAAAAGTTVSAATTAIAAAAATQGLISNRLSSFRAASGAPAVGRAFNGESRQIFAFGTSGTDTKTPGISRKSEVARKKALREANGRYDPPVESEGIAESREDLSDLRLGVSAGENPDNRVGLWANGAMFRLDGSKTNANIESDVLTGMIGLDYRFGPRFLVGVSGGYENTDTTTTFNNGTVDSDGFIIAPYMSIGLTDRLSIDAVVGYGMIDYDMTRRDPLSNATITGSTEATRLFGSVDLVAGERLDRWLLEGRVGASHLNEEQDSFRESNGVLVGENEITVSSGNLGARVGYSFTMVEPYVAGLYSYDFNKAEGAYDGRNTFGGALGLNWWLTPRFLFNLEGKATHKEDLDTYGGSATMRLNF